MQIDMNNLWLFHNKYEKLFTSKSINRKAYCNELTTENVFEYIFNLITVNKIF